MCHVRMHVYDICLIHHEHLYLGTGSSARFARSAARCVIYHICTMAYPPPDVSYIIAQWHTFNDIFEEPFWMVRDPKLELAET